MRLFKVDAVRLLAHRQHRSFLCVVTWASASAMNATLRDCLLKKGFNMLTFGLIMAILKRGRLDRGQTTEQVDYRSFGRRSLLFFYVENCQLDEIMTLT